MPDLPSVEQTFTADTSGYVDAIAEMIAANITLRGDIDTTIAKIGELGAAVSALPDSKVIKVSADTTRALKDIGAVSRALDSLGDREITVTVRYVTAGDVPDAVRGAVTVPASGGGGGGADVSDLLLREARDTSASLDMLNSTIGAIEEHLSVMRTAATDSSADLVMQTQMMRDAQSSPAAALAAAIAGGGRRGGGGGAGAALAAAAGGGAASFGSGPFAPGTAGADATAIIGFVRRWWGAVHWTIMGVNETLATAGPALAAAGAAALVGQQANERLTARGQAISTTAEALGGVSGFGMTAGQYLGVGNALQRYQNLAEGGVYELPGAAINALKSGAGSSPFLQMGLNTVAMVDRGVANMGLNMQAKGTMGTLASALGGGTGDLQAFGDVGANLGNMFLGLAPHLPGVGGDYLAGLKGITGLLSGGIGFLNQTHMGDVLGAGLSFEAAARVGKPLLGLAGRGIGVLGRGVYGAGSALAEAGLGSAAGDVGLGTMSAGMGLGGIADVLGALTGPEVGAMGVSAFLASKLWAGSVSPAQRQISALQASVNQAGYTGAWQPLGHAITTAAGLSAAPPLQKGVGAPSATEQMQMGADQTASSFIRFGQMGPTAQSVYQQGAQGFTGQMKDLLQSGPQLVTLLQGLGMHGVTMAQAFQIAQHSLLDLGHAFGSTGKLTGTAQQMVKNYTAALAPMTQNAGGFGAAIAAQSILSSPQMKDLSTVNQSMDSMTQIMTGGPAAMSALVQLLGGTPTTKPPKKAGMDLPIPPAYRQMAQALTSFTTSGSAAAWQTFAGPQGLVTAQQQNLDQLRTAMSLGAVTEPQAQGLAGFQLLQMLPLSKKSPAALSMLMQQGAQMGIGASGPGGGYYQPGVSQKENYQNAVQAFSQIADNSQQANSAMNQMTENLSNLPQMAQQFSQGLNADMMSQRVAAAATDMAKLQDSVKTGPRGKVTFDTGALTSFVSEMQKAGIQGGNAIKASVDAALKGVVSPQALASIDAALSKVLPKLQVQADISQIQAQMAALRGKTLVVNVQSAGVGAVQAAVSAIKGKSVTVEVIQHYSVTGTPVTGLGSVRTISGTGTVGSLGGHTSPGAQSGMRVPGYGGGDIVHAMLEPGEAVVPKHLVGAVAPFLAAHQVPGFQEGGIAGDVLPMVRDTMTNIAGGMLAALGTEITQLAAVSASAAARAATAGGGGPAIAARVGGVPGHIISPPGGAPPPSGPSPLVPQNLSGQMQQLLAQLTAELAKAGIGKHVAVSIVSGLNAAMANQMGASGLAKLAQTLVTKLEKEISYAKSVSSAAMSGLGLGQMDTTQGSVSQGMQNYLTSVKSFTADLKTLSAQGLNKSVIQQMVAAGPVQGDLLAQSILGGMKKTLAANAVAGLNLAGMNVTPGTGSGTVQEQMQSYLGNLQSFTGDIGTLQKQGLNKQIVQQLLQAGPQQGDALAQSILSGPGGVTAANQLYGQITAQAGKLGEAGAPAFGPIGVKSVNQLWGQLTGATQGLGAAAAGAVYGGTLAPNLKSATVTNNNVTVNVSVPGGGSGNLDLTPAQIKQLVEQVQAALLKQARRNPQTGLKLKGKGA